jgi:chemotaxis protein CheD
LGVIAVGPGEVRAAAAPAALEARAVGEGIAISLHDPVQRVGGLAHALCASAPGEPRKSVEGAVRSLLDELAKLGAQRERLAGKMAGGAQVFEGLEPRGELIVRAARAVLDAHGIVLAGWDVGGRAGRTAALDVESGRLTVRTRDGEERAI